MRERKECSNFADGMRKGVLTTAIWFCTVAGIYAAKTPTEGTEIQGDTLQTLQVVSERMQAQQHSLTTAVSTIRMQRIEQEQQVTYKDLSGIVPNLYIPDYGSKMTSSIYLRGLGARIDNPVLGVYVDGIGTANKNSYDTDLFDIRSMQVYRGPQGTLFGRNTIGGILLIETLSPLDWQGTRANIGYGNYETAEGKISHYARIGQGKNTATARSEWGIGAAAYYRHCGGYFINEYDHTRADKSDEAGVRLRLEGKTASGWRNSNTLSYNFTTQSGFPYHQPEQSINHNDPSGYSRHSLTAGSHYGKTTGGYAISGSTSYQYLQDRMEMDQDYLPEPYFTLIQAQQEHFVSQEVTIRPAQGKVFAGDWQWDWLTGAQVTYKHNKMHAPVHFKQTGIDSLIVKNANNGLQTAFPEAQFGIAEDNFVIGSDFTTQAADIAAYHTSYLKYGHWLIEAGLRIEAEYQHFRYNSEGTVHYTVKSPTLDLLREIQSHITDGIALWYIETLPRIAVSYKSRLTESKNGWEAYASISEGYKAGGFNTQLFSDILQNTMMEDIMGDMGVGFADGGEYKTEEVITYKPERCLNFEVGASGRLQTGGTLLHGAVTLYEAEIFNQQLTTFPKKGTGRMMTNAGHSRTLGGEATASLRYERLHAEASYGYTHAYFTVYNNGRQDLSGKRVPYAPEHTVSASISYSIDLKHSFFHSLDLNANTQAFGRIWWNEENTEVQPMYALLNANLTLRMRYVSLSLWGKNLTQTDYTVFRFVSMGNTFLQSGKPLTFGGKIRIEI